MKRDFTEKYEIIYIDFSTTLHRIGNGFEYILFRKQVEERLTNLKISNLSHFSHEEVADYDSFPKPSVIITCESFTNTFPSTTSTAISEPCNVVASLTSTTLSAITTLPST